MPQRLLVEVPAGSYEPERRYACEVLLKAFLGLDYVLVAGDRRDTRLTLEGAEGEVVVADGLFAMPAARWLTPGSLPVRPLRWWRGGERPLPVLYGRAPFGPTREGARCEIGCDLFGGAFFMLTRYEEVACPAADARGRFPASASLAAREGFLDLPLVDEYTEVLWAAMAAMWPQLSRKPRRYRVFLSHDVDWPHSALGRRASVVAHACAGDLVRRRPGLAAARLRSLLRCRRQQFGGDPFDSFDFVMAESERRGLKSAFYFIADHTAGTLDGAYALEHPWIQGLMRKLHHRGHELGLHPSYHTYRDAAQTRRELERLESAARRAGVAQARWGGRQHYLRWEAPGTWQNWESAGLSYDSTLTYPEQPGFRCGTCREFPVFNLATRQPLRLLERPLVAMDVTLTNHLRLAPGRLVSTLADLSATCRRFGGDFSLLWHNSELATGAQRRCYAAALEAIAP